VKLEYDPKADAAYVTQCAGVPFAFTHHAAARRLAHERTDGPVDQHFASVHELARPSRDEGVPAGLAQLAPFVASGGRHRPATGGHDRRFTLVLAGTPAVHERDVERRERPPIEGRRRRLREAVDIPILPSYAVEAER
jgi:hypothetical protein